MKIIKLHSRKWQACMVSLFFAVSFNASAVLISDSTFADSDWTATVLSSAGTVSQTATQNTPGGNPGDFRFMQHSFDSIGNIFVYHEFSGTNYDPSAGAIDSLEYKEDQIQIAPLPFAASAIGARAAIKQGGTVYVSEKLNFTNQSWNSVTKSGYTAASFVDFDTETVNPDFSTAGGVITFGYLRFNKQSTGIAYPNSTQSGIDNWSYNLNISAVPLPAAFWLFGCSLLGLLGVKSRFA